MLPERTGPSERTGLTRMSRAIRMDRAIGTDGATGVDRAINIDRATGMKQFALDPLGLKVRTVQLKDVLVRRLPVRVMLAAHHERCPGDLLAADPPAAFGVAVDPVPGGQDAGQQSHLAEVRAEPGPERVPLAGLVVDSRDGQHPVPEGSHHAPVSSAAGRARLGWPRFGSPGIFGYSGG